MFGLDTDSLSEAREAVTHHAISEVG